MLETERMRSSVWCPCGHGFGTELIVCINTDTDPELFFTLSQDGSQLVVCPTCTTSWSLCEPVLIHTPSGMRLILLIPDALSHKTLALKAAALLSLKDAAPEQLTSDMIQFPALSRRAVEELLNPVADQKSTRSIEPPAGIARAFADLSSIIPTPIRK